MTIETRLNFTLATTLEISPELKDKLKKAFNDAMNETLKEYLEGGHYTPSFGRLDTAIAEVNQIAAERDKWENRANALERVVMTLRAADDWHEDDGFVLWWTVPIEEPPYVGSPLCSDWPGYHTHWTPVICPNDGRDKEGDPRAINELERLIKESNAE